MKLDWNGFWSVAPSSHETKTEWSLVIRTELTPKEVTEFSLRLQLSAWTSTRLFDLSVSLPNSPGVLGNNQENLMKHKVKHLTKIPWMHYQKRWKRSFNCNRCWNMWSLNSRADVCHMRWPFSCRWNTVCVIRLSGHRELAGKQSPCARILT